MLLNNAVEIINSARWAIGDLSLKIARNQQVGKNYTEDQKKLKARRLWTYVILRTLDPILKIENNKITQILGDANHEKINRLLLCLKSVSGAYQRPLLQGLLNPIGERKTSSSAPGAAGADGESAYLYVGYAEDDSGTGYSTSPAGKTYIAFKVSNIPLTVTSATFTGLWRKFVGENGAAGEAGSSGSSSYTFQAWADADDGTGYTLTFDSSKKYTAFLIKDNDTEPEQSDFDGKWVKYVGDDGANGSPGVNGNTILTGSGAPSDALGEDGDLYLDTDLYNIYGPKTSGAWGAPVSLKGPKGDSGEDGEDGEDGNDGSNAYLYIAYADSSDGTGFTMTFSTSKSYIAFLQTDTEIAEPDANDFAGLWTKFKGEGGDRYATYSTTSLTIGTGVKNLVVEKDLSYTTGQRVVIAVDGDPSNRMEGLVVNYTTSNGQMSVNIDTVIGTGTHSVWDVNVAGAGGGGGGSALEVAEVDTTQSTIELDMEGKGQLMFVGSDDIDGARTWQVLNDGAAKDFKFSFVIDETLDDDSHDQTMPSNFLMADARVVPASSPKVWRPLAPGLYHAKAWSYDNGTTWYLEITDVFT